MQTGPSLSRATPPALLPLLPPPTMPDGNRTASPRGPRRDGCPGNVPGTTGTEGPDRPQPPGAVKVGWARGAAKQRLALFMPHGTKARWRGTVASKTRVAARGVTSWGSCREGGLHQATPSGASTAPQETPRGPRGGPCVAELPSSRGKKSSIENKLQIRARMCNSTDPPPPPAPCPGSPLAFYLVFCDPGGTT